MLTVSSNRQPLTRTAAVIALAGMFAVAIPLAAVTLTERQDPSTVVASAMRDVALPAPEPAIPPITLAAARPRALPRVAAAAVPQAPASVSGSLRDISGAMLPGVLLTLTNSESQTSSATTSDANGSFVFRNVPPATYALVAQLPGFSTLKKDLKLDSGQNMQTGLTLQVGQITETVTVTCAPATATTPQVPSVLAFDRRATAPRLFETLRQSQVIPSLAAQPLRIGGQIAAPRRTKVVNPVCPAPLPASAGGIVILEATIGLDGVVKDLKVLRSLPQRPEFDQAATEAIRQWEYTPTRLNNVPIPVIMTVSVVFATQ